jgi:hypothetical protein
MRRPLPLENHNPVSRSRPHREFGLEKPIRGAKKFPVWRDLNFCVLNSNQQRRDGRGCRSVELRALCNEVPRTPPGPEGSNGIGIASGAADHPKFLALKSSWSSVAGRKPSSRGCNCDISWSHHACVFYGLRRACVFCVLAYGEQEFEIA